MTLQQLNYLAEIVEQGSINRAAKSLFVSQSSISSALRDLEEEMGVVIFLRNNRGVELTDDGRRFYDQIRPMLDQEKRVLDTYSGRSGPSAFKLRISSQHYPFAVQAFVKLVQMAGGGQYNVHLRETYTHYIIEDVATGESELGLLFVSNVTEQFIRRNLSARNLEFNLLKRVDPHVYLRRDHPLSIQTLLETSQLHDYPYAVFGQGERVSYNFSEEVALEDFDAPDRAIHINDRCTMYNVLAHTDAFTVGSGLLAEGYCDPNIIAIPLHVPNDEIRLGWISQCEHPVSAAAQMYIDLLEECLEEDGQ